MTGKFETTPRTEGDLIIEGLKLYWFGDRALGLALIGIVTDWREDKAMMATAGQDGAA